MTAEILVFIAFELDIYTSNTANLISEKRKPPIIGGFLDFGYVLAIQLTYGQPKIFCVFLSETEQVVAQVTAEFPTVGV